jgi:hypothetical protein
MKQPPLKYGLVKFLHGPVDLANPLVSVRTHQSFAEVARSTKVSFSLKAHSNKKWILDKNIPAVTNKDEKLHMEYLTAASGNMYKM